MYWRRVEELQSDINIALCSNDGVVKVNFLNYFVRLLDIMNTHTMIAYEKMEKRVAWLEKERDLCITKFIESYL